MKKLLIGLLGAALAWGQPACDDEDEKKKGDGGAKAAKTEKTGKGSKGDKSDKGDKPTVSRLLDLKSRATAGKTSPTATRLSGAAANELARGFTRWKPLPVFLSDKIYDAAAIGDGNAIVLTNDNHVGVTKNAGKNWHYQRVLHGSSHAVHGRAGGPYYVAGKNGFVAWSLDSLEWHDLPKVTNADFFDVAVNDTIAVAISRGGVVVSYDNDGSSYRGFAMPAGKRPEKIYSLDGKILLKVGREVWATSDKGRSWGPTDVHPTLPDPRLAPTSQGLCRLGRVEKTYGLVCEVKGDGYAVTDQEIFVVDRDKVQVTKDGGKTWQLSPLPFAGTRKIGGFAGGPYFALGARGSLAKSADGITWSTVTHEAKGNLNDVLAKKRGVIIVGSGGTILLSADRGASFGVVDPGAKKNFTHIVLQGSTLLLPAGPSLYASTDGGRTWSEPGDKTQYGELPKDERIVKCTDILPKAGKACRVARIVTSPESFPRARMFDFSGDFGIMVGLKGLVAVTPDGGSNWNYNFGYSFWGDIQDLVVRGKRIVVIAHQQVMASVDGGRTWRQGLLPKRIGKLNSAFIDDDGAVYVAGEWATLLKGVGRLGTWVKLDTQASRWTAFLKVLRAGSALYACGFRGELYRSRDRGRTWHQIFIGQTHPVVNMIARGKMVLAVTTTAQGRWWTRNRGDGVLLRSDNDGYNFRVLGGLSAGGSGRDFHMDAEGRVIFHNLVSADMGRTWSTYRQHYRGGLEKVGDGRYIGNRRFQNKRDLFYVVDRDMKKYTIIESFYHENAMLRCDPAAGCWMASGSVLYRPF